MFPEKWYFYLAYAAFFSLLIPISIGISNWKRLNRSFRILLLWIILHFIIFAIEIIVGRFMGKDTIYLFLFDSINSCICFTYFYYTLLSNQRLKKWLLIPAIIVTSIIIYNIFIYFNGNESQFSVIVENIFVLSISVLFLAKVVVSSDANKSLNSNPFFLVLLAKIIPTFFELLISAFTDYLMLENTNLLIGLYEINYVLHVIGNIAFAIGIWKSLNYEIKTFNEI